MLNRVVDPNKPVGEGDLRQFELRHGIIVPASYREFLLTNNGGQPAPAGFPITGAPSNPFGVVQAFFGLKADIATEDLDLVLGELPVTVPRRVLPIACTGSGDYICLDLRQSGAPVMFWDRVPFWGNEVWSEGDLYPVAPNFEAFLETLHDPETRASEFR